MKHNIPMLMLLITFTLPVKAERLTPTPEPGLWRSESRTLTFHEAPSSSLPDTPRLAELPPSSYRALLDTAINEATPVIVMECIPVSQTAEMGQLVTLQKTLQRKLPECELDLHKVNRSAIKVSGQCHAGQGFKGDVHGLIEFVSSHLIHASFLGSDQPHTHDGTPSISGQANVQRHEVHRWTSSDCGHIQPEERLSF